ncbi:MAG: hypothetical protein SFY32_13515 [Bacteroidota bacterium]|nr:hypothetical protein [Bacteroidota bacterium]
MKKQSNISALAMTAYFLLAFYIYGATVMEVFVYYPSWQHIHSDWITFKKLVDSLIIPRYVVPTMLVYIPLIIMFWHRSKSLPKWTIWASLVGYLIPTISTMLVQLPIQFKLEEGFDQALYEKLMWTDLYYRQIAAFFGFVLSGYMLFRVVRQAE